MYIMLPSGFQFTDSIVSYFQMLYITIKLQ